MANCWFYSAVILLSLSIHTMAFNQKQVKAVPISAKFAGVFMMPEDGKYVFDAIGASGACLRLDATIATREQMEVAMQRGFQTCKFGWIEGPQAVIPRKIPDPKCGNNKVGLVSWNIMANKNIVAYCFKSDDVHTTTTIPVAIKPMTTATRRRYAWTAASTQVPRYTSWAPPLNEPRWKYLSRPPPRSPALPLKPWYLSSSSSPSSLATSSTSSLPLHSTSPAAPRAMTSPTSTGKGKSTPARASSLSSFPLHPSSSATTTTSTTTKSPTENVPLQPPKASMGALRVALIVVGLIFLVVSAAASSWYCKLPRCLFPPPWARPQKPRNKAETEMWKHTDSDTHLQTQLSEEDKTDGKNATEVTLCVSQSDTNTIAVV